MVTVLKGKGAFNRERLNFYVYNASLGRADAMTSLAVSGVTTNGFAATSLATVELPDAASVVEVNALTTVLTAVTYQARSFTVNAGVPAGATYAVSGGRLVRPVTCDPEASSTCRRNGVSVPLNHHVTGGTTNTGGDVARMNPITVTVTAENGYHDNVYTFNAFVTNPIGNTVATSDINIVETGTGGNSGNPTGVGSTNNAFQWTSGLSTTSSVNVWMTMDLVPGTGVGNVPVQCAQSIDVSDQNGDEVAVTKHANDDCPGRFTLPLAAAGNSMTYSIKMYSEDGRDATYSLTLHTNSGS